MCIPFSDVCASLYCFSLQYDPISPFIDLSVAVSRLISLTVLHTEMQRNLTNEIQPREAFWLQQLTDATVQAESTLNETSQVASVVTDWWEQPAQHACDWYTQSISASDPSVQATFPVLLKRFQSLSTSSSSSGSSS